MLDELLMKNRSCRGYTPRPVTEKELYSMVEAARLAPCSRNGQALRYRLVTGEETLKVLKSIKLGGALPEIGLPLPGTEPRAYIILCVDEDAGEHPFLFVDMGIAVQTLLLKAVESGLQGVCIGAFNAGKIVEALSLEGYKPCLVLALGESAEEYEIVDIRAGEKQKYYRRDGVHCVPKIVAEDLIIPKP